MSVTDETLREWVGREAGTIDLSDVEANEIFAELLALRAEVDFERKRVWTLIEQTDTIPGSDFRKQMAFNQKRYEGACKRADEANDRVKGLEAKVRESREYRVSMAATVERLGRVVAAAREVHMICDRYDELHIDDIPCNECDTCTLRLAIERMDAR